MLNNLEQSKCKIQELSEMRDSIARIEACFRGLKSREEQIGNRVNDLEILSSQPPEDSTLLKPEANVCKLIPLGVKI